MNVAMTQEQENEFSKQLNGEVEDLINVEGTKVKISSKLIKVRFFQHALISLTPLRNIQQ